MPTNLAEASVNQLTEVYILDQTNPDLKSYPAIYKPS
jgi:hypothetical protein